MIKNLYAWTKEAILWASSDERLHMNNEQQYGQQWDSLRRHAIKLDHIIENNIVDKTDTKLDPISMDFKKFFDPQWHAPYLNVIHTIEMWSTLLWHTTI